MDLEADNSKFKKADAHKNEEVIHKFMLLFLFSISILGQSLAISGTLCI